jgi:large subunit ribosomal protein L13
VARVLTGKNKPQYTPFLDTGDHVIVINARQAIFKGSKNEQKMYHHHTLYPGGLRSISVKDQFERYPERVIELAVKGMLPKTKLGRAMAKKLKVYGDDEGLRRHAAQRPQPLALSPRAAAQKA